MRTRRLLVLITAILALSGCAAATYPPDPRALEDARLVARVKTALLNAGDLDATRIDVGAAGGTVRLTGEVPAEDHERRAVEVARRVPGVIEVTSTLAISRVPRRTTVRS